MLAAQPHRRAHTAVRLDRVARPVAAWIIEIVPAGESHANDLVTELAGIDARQRGHGFKVTRSAMQDKDADLLAIWPTRRVFRRLWLEHTNPHVPVEPETLDPENVFRLVDGNVAAPKHFLRDCQRFFARYLWRRGPCCAVDHWRLLYYLSRCRVGALARCPSGAQFPRRYPYMHRSYAARGPKAGTPLRLPRPAHSCCGQAVSARRNRPSSTALQHCRARLC